MESGFRPPGALTNTSLGGTVVGSLAVVNYYLEKGARILYNMQKTHNKRQRSALSDDYEAQSHLYAETVEDVLNTWRPYGYLNTMVAGKMSDMQLNCFLGKDAFILNYWGNVTTGDKLYWVVKQVRNPYPHFIDPSGNIAGDSTGSPAEFLQIIPMVGKNGHAPTHCRDVKGTPRATDLDFMARNVEITQQDAEIGLVSGKFKLKPLDLKKEAIQTTKLVTDLYCYGALLFVGTVRSSGQVRGNHNPEVLSQALRNDRLAKSLDKIEVELGC